MKTGMDAERAAFFRRSYCAVDGLWFMMVEERLGFEAALDIDAQVWQVMAKIQARELRRLLDAPMGIDGLAQCLKLKFAWESFDAQIERPNADTLRCVLQGCPWHEAMVRSGREHLSGRVGERICPVEFAVWADEFAIAGRPIEYALDALLCTGQECCILTFHQRQTSAAFGPGEGRG
jgi:hypothetical protein